MDENKGEVVREETNIRKLSYQKGDVNLGFTVNLSDKVAMQNLVDCLTMALNELNDTLAK